MNENLLNLIHKYAEDREIDWMAAKIIGEQQGIKFKDENNLLEWKNTVDRYLKTFSESNFDKIEEYINESKITLNSDEGYEEYGSGKFTKKFKTEKNDSRKKRNKKKEYAKIRAKKRN